MKQIIALIAVCLGLTLLDIFVVEGFYRPTEAWSEIWKYHAVLIGLAVVLPLIASKLTKSLMPIGAWIYFIFGLEDTLYYGLQGYLPQIYYGVYVTGIWQPTLETVLKLNLCGIVLLTVFIWIVRRCEVKANEGFK